MGDTLQTATLISATSQVVNDSLSSSNSNDYFRFTLETRSSFNLTLGNLTADANLQLLDSGGLVLQASTNSGQTTELINEILEPATYYIRVFSASTPISSSYTLSLMVQSSNQQVNTLWRDCTTGENVIWTMGGTHNTSVVSSIALSAVPTNWAVVAIADWNGDGISDLIWREYVNGLNGVWLMGGTNHAEITATVTLPTDAAPNWYIYGVADFNGDEALDLLWHSDGGDTGFWLMGGTNHAETMAIVMLPNAAPNWLIGGVADFDGDGNTDLFWHDSASGLNGFWWMQGTALVSTELSEISNHPDARVQGITDFNQDGNPDILWRMPDGDNLIWFMEGTTLKSAGSLGTTSPNLWITPFVQGINPTAIDPAGNTTATAFQVGSLTGTAIYSDRVSTSDPEDYFQFTLNSLSDLSLALSGLPSSSVQLLDSSGTLINGYTNLATGTYFVRIDNGSGDYTFSLTAAAPPPPPLPTVSISSSSNAAEPSTNGSFTISRTGSTDQALTVNYAIAGTATSGTDYQTSGQSVVIPAGQASVTVPIVVIDDSQQEDDETITLTLTSSTAYTIDTINTGTVTIADDDLIVIPPGDAGNTLATAKNLGTVRTTPTVQSDRVDASDKKDYYKITLATSARLRATVTGLTADLDIELLDSTGYLLDFSDNSGTAAESISRILSAGIYHLFIYPYGSAQSNYTLNVWQV